MRGLVTFEGPAVGGDSPDIAEAAERNIRRHAATRTTRELGRALLELPYGIASDLFELVLDGIEAAHEIAKEEQ